MARASYLEMTDILTFRYFLADLNFADAARNISHTNVDQGHFSDCWVIGFNDDDPASGNS
jgi:hypothetical protein